MVQGDARGFVLIGMEAGFTRAVLAGLLHAGACTPRSVVCAAPGRLSRFAGIEVRSSAGEGGLSSLCRQRGIPVRLVGDAGELAAVLETYPDCRALVACLPWRLDEKLLQRFPELYNLHPSQLPRYRGPDPLFWQFQAGEAGFGVTLHRVSATVDGGGVVAQRRMPVAAGTTRDEVERALATIGAGLFCECLASDRFPSIPQDEARATRFGAPRQIDYRLSTSWTVERAYRFIAGVGGDGVPFSITGPGTALTVRGALDPATADRPLAADLVELRFADGVLAVQPG